MSQDRDGIRRVILQAALRAVPFDGWSAQTLDQAVEAIKATGIDTAQARSAFPGGAKQLLSFFMAEAEDRKSVV